MPPKRKRDYFDYGKGGGKRITVRVNKKNRRRKSNLYNRRRNMRTAGFLSIERKFYDTNLNETAIPAPTDCTGGEFDPSATSMMTTPTVGDGEQQRDGKQIVCLYLEIKGHVRTSAIEAAIFPGQYTQALVAIVLDKQTNGAQLNSEDVFKNLNGQAVTATEVMRNLLFGKRFRILKERVFDITPNATTQQAANDYSTSQGGKSFHWFIPLNNLKINFNAGTTASIANVLDNSIHVIAFSNNTALTPVIAYNARLRFMG